MNIFVNVLVMFLSHFLQFLLWLETTKKQQQNNSVEIGAYLKPSWILASTKKQTKIQKNEILK